MFSIDKNHLKKIKMSYFKHLIFTIYLAAHCFIMMVVILMHGLLPMVMTNWFSSLLDSCKKTVDEKE